MRGALPSDSRSGFSGHTAFGPRLAFACATIAAAAMAISLSPVAASEHPAKPGNPDTSSLGSDSCVSCHRFDGTMSHPVNFTPRKAIPSYLPLDAGRITCTTCHDPTQHRQSRAGSSLRNGLDSRSMCSACHSASDRTENPHASAGFRAHLVQTRSNSRAKSLASSLDTESQSCMGCHDGSLASDAGSHRSMRSLDHENQEHPVGTVYSSASSKLSEMKLVPASRLDARVRLFDGKVGCGSCHSPYSHVSKQLIMSNSGSKLCLTCHENR